MNKINDGGPAFPVPPPNLVINDTVIYSDPGMTLRDWFAGQALIGFTNSLYGTAQTDPKFVAKLSYKLADAMIAEREKRS